MLLLWIARALADEYSYEYGGTYESYTGSGQAVCFGVETTVTVTSIGAYVKKDSDATSSSFTIAMWRESGSGSWSVVQSTSGSQTSTSGFDFIERSVSWELQAGESYCLGSYHSGNMVGFVVDERQDDPAFGYLRGSVYAAANGRLDTPPAREDTLTTKLRYTVEVADADGDGADALQDCDDDDPDATPGGRETWYDGVDGDCDGRSDFDQDGDGADADSQGGSDCDDTDPEIGPGQRETWYDGVDGDCSGGSDYDKDGDGDDAQAHGGGDCDDEDPAVSTLAEEVWYDGFDQDCSGGSDFDQDGDGHDTPSAGGDDCDDLDAALATDCDGGPFGGGGDDDEEDEDDDDDHDDASGCLCTGSSGLVFVGVAVPLARRRRTRA